MKKFLIVAGLAISAMTAGLADDIVKVTPPDSKPPEVKLPGNKGVAELLSDHLVEAELVEIVKRPCMHRTALCPDRCDHAKHLAIFKVTKYLRYDKPGQYGDEETHTIYVDVDPRHKPIQQPDDIIGKITALKKGDKVEIHWTHYYIKDDHGAYPERPIMSIKPLK